MMAEAMPSSAGQLYLAVARNKLRSCLERIKHCVGQLDDTQVSWRPRDTMNSIANIILHLCGNVRQWVIAGVTKAPDTRSRPQEFADRTSISREELLRCLEAVLAEADTVLSMVSDAQLVEQRKIQGFDETVLSGTFDS